MTKLAILLAASLLVSGGGGLVADSWCELPFQDVARHAAVIALAEFDVHRDRAPLLRIVEVLRGECKKPLLLSRGVRLSETVRNGDRFLLALTAGCEPVEHVRGLGSCAAINALPINKDKLRARDRQDYDGRNSAMTLEQLRAELRVQR